MLKEPLNKTKEQVGALKGRPKDALLQLISNLHKHKQYKWGLLGQPITP